MQSDTRTPVILAVFAMLVNLCLAALLVGPWELEGVALALSVATTLEALLLFYCLAGRMPTLLADGLLGALLRMVNAGALMIIAVAGARLALVNVVGLENDRGLDALAIVVLCAATGAATYGAAASAMGLQARQPECSCTATREVRREGDSDALDRSLSQPAATAMQVWASQAGRQALPLTEEFLYDGTEGQAVRGLDQQHIARSQVGAQHLDGLLLRFEVAHPASARHFRRRRDLHAPRPDREQRIDDASGVLSDAAMPVRLGRTQLQHVAKQGVAIAVYLLQDVQRRQH